MLAGAGRLSAAAKPILEVNPRHRAGRWRSPRSATTSSAFKEDAAHLLLDEARVLDGERPADARAFSERLARVLGKGLSKGTV